MKKILFVVFSSFVLISAYSVSVLGDSLESIIADYAERITEYNLDNGMRFLILEDSSAPVVAFHVQVNAGSVYEGPWERGANHLIEHLAFSGTPQIGTIDWQEEKKLLDKLDKLHLQVKSTKKDGASDEFILSLEEEFEAVRLQAASLAEPNQFAAILDRQGAVGPNAFVSHDFTVYWVELPSDKFELWACLESNRLFNSVLRLFYEEIEIVKEERRTVVDNSPGGRLMEEFRAAAYKVHSYRYPIIGYMEDIKGLNRERVKELYQKYYVPSNILISIVGDISFEKIQPVLDKYFGSIPAKEPPSLKVAQEPPRSAERRVRIKMESQPLLLVGYNIPFAGSPDIPALRVAAQIIGQGQRSRLHKRLVQEEQIAAVVDSWAWVSRYPGLFYILVVAADGYTNAEIEPLIYEEIGKFLDEPPAKEEVEAAQARLKMNFIQSLKSRRNLASGLAWFQEVTGSWRNFFKMQEFIFEVEPEDVHKVIRRYFTKENRTVGSLEPVFDRE